MALVQFDDARDAKKAYAGLAYKKFQHVPLYLEWAPEAVFAGEQGSSASAKPQAATQQEEEPEPSEEEVTSLFVKNINFDTTESALKRHFADAGIIRSAT